MTQETLGAWSVKQVGDKESALLLCPYLLLSDGKVSELELSRKMILRSCSRLHLQVCLPRP